MLWRFVKVIGLIVVSMLLGMYCWMAKTGTALNPITGWNWFWVVVGVIAFAALVLSRCWEDDK